MWAGVGAVRDKTSGNVWLQKLGLGLRGCYLAVIADSRCTKDYFNYVTRGDENCGCKAGYTGGVAVQSDHKTDHYSIFSTYTWAGSKGTAASANTAPTGSIWLGIFDLGLQGCYEAVLADSRCSKDYFNYVLRGDKNCGCKTDTNRLVVLFNEKVDFYKIVPGTFLWQIQVMTHPSNG